MLIQATRTISAFTLRVLFYLGLFIAVVLVHMAVTSGLARAGWPSGLSLFGSGALVLATVLFAINFSDLLREQRAAAQERGRRRQGLPEGPCCVIWRGDIEPEQSDAMPWEPAEPLRLRYPRLAARLRIEGLAVVEFEIGADGAAKNLQCLEAWPSEVFFDAAREALRSARFQPKFDMHVRFGAAYRMPFVFRIHNRPGRVIAGTKQLNFLNLTERQSI